MASVLDVPPIPPIPPAKALNRTPSPKSLAEKQHNLTHRPSHVSFSEPPQHLAPKASTSSLALPPSRQQSRTSLADRHHAHPSLSDRELPPVPSTSHLSPLVAGPSSLSVHTSVRSEGEDADAFHVRSTYAHLDSQGVEGDGYEEGIELTRAKQNGTDYLISQSRDRRPVELTAKERAVLASVDRYGFFVAPSSSNDRALLLPTSAFSKPLTRLPASPPKKTPAKPPPLSAIPQLPADVQKEISRAAKWRRMLESKVQDGSGNVMNWRVVPRKERKLRERVYKGVPDAWRAAAWALMMDRNAPRGMRMEELERDYREALLLPSTFDIQIDLDVPRTISGHVMFRTRYGAGQRSLFHVLHAFSLRCEECGYVQGMGPIAATLLCYFDPEKVYAMMVHLHDEYDMHAVFSPGFPGLLESIYVMERVVERVMPGVYGVLKSHMISSTSYTTRWYITLFANCVPFQTQLRLWDAFFYEGRDMLVIIAVAVLWVFRDYLTSANANFETILSMLSSYFVPESEDTLMKWIERALGDGHLRAEMAAWRKEWGALVREGKGIDKLL
ncbi:hypothetical protein M422DRAFT_154639 [Sphaerobolus stellatus SS14]|nr:hypothetical protein M422DRAFT_154639 [Sphaerobolus stellatus SS14]